MAFFLSFADTEPSVLSYYYGNAYGLGYDLGIEPRVRGQWIFLQFAVFLVFLLLPLFRAKLLWLYLVRRCWEEERMLLSKCVPAESALYFPRNLSTVISWFAKIWTLKKPPSLHTNEWSLLKVSKLQTHSRYFFSLFCITSPNHSDAAVSEECYISCRESWHVFAPSGVWVLLSPALVAPF